MPDETLVLLTNDVRGKTLRLLQDVSPELARFAPPGLQNTILWHAGHALVVVEQLSFVAVAAAKAQYPADWFDKFSWKSNPATVRQWPELNDVAARLTDQQQRLLALIESLTPEQLSKKLGDAPQSRNVRGSILHGLHDEANHQGEIHLLKKLWAKKQMNAE